MSGLKKICMMANMAEEEKIILPEGYVKLEYIKCSGTQYIDTPYTWGDVHSFEAVVRSDYSGAINISVIGSNTNNSNMFWGLRAGAVMEWQWSTSILPSIKIKARINVNNTGNEIQGAEGSIFDFATDEEKSTVYSGFVPPYNSVVKLFATATTRKYQGECYYIAINGNPIVPLLRLSDNKPGMYDLISGKFLTNQGTGEFEYKIKE